MVAQAIAAVEPVRAQVRTVQRFFHARENGDFGAAEFRRVEGVASGLLNGDVSGNRGNYQNVRVRGERSAMIKATASSEAVSVSIRKRGFTRRRIAKSAQSRAQKQSRC